MCWVRSVNTNTSDDVRTITLSNGEISTVQQTDGTIYNYTYDTKNSPFKNVTGYAEIVYASAGDFEIKGRSHNIVSIVDETHSQNYTTSSFQYNADNFPTSLSSVAIFDSGSPTVTDELTVQFFYE